MGSLFEDKPNSNPLGEIPSNTPPTAPITSGAPSTTPKSTPAFLPGISTALNTTMNVGNATQAQFEQNWRLAALQAQAAIDQANISAGATRYRADIDLLISKMQLAYSYYRLQALEIPQALASDDLARHQLAINAAVQFAQLSGWVNPMDFDTRRIMEHSLNKQGQQINGAPVTAQQFLESANMKPVLSEAKANGWGDADAEAILTTWVNSNDGDDTLQESVDKAKRILQTDMGTYAVAAKQGDLYSQVKLVKNAVYVNKMSLTPTNPDPFSTKNEVQEMVDKYVTIPTKKVEQIPFSQATPQQRTEAGTSMPGLGQVNTMPAGQAQPKPEVFTTAQMMGMQPQPVQGQTQPVSPTASKPPEFNMPQQTPSVTTQGGINSTSVLPKNLEKPPVWG